MVRPRFNDFDYDDSRDIPEASSSYYIECSTCLTRIDCDGYENTLPEDEALAEIHKLLDGKEWSSDELPLIAEILGRAGKVVRDPSEVQ